MLCKSFGFVFPSRFEVPSVGVFFVCLGDVCFFYFRLVRKDWEQITVLDDRAVLLMIGRFFQYNLNSLQPTK